MKIDKRKQVLSLVAVMIIMLTGSFITVNAAKKGELVDKVKDTIKVVLVTDNGEEELKGTEYIDSNNHAIEKYEYNNNGREYKLEVDKTNIDKENITINETIKEDDEEIDIIIQERNK